MKKLFIALIFVLLGTLFSKAETTWIEIYDDKEVTIYMSKDIRQTDNGGYRVWEKHEYKKPQLINKKTYNYIIALTEYDKYLERFKTFADYYYNKYDKFLHSKIDKFPEWEYVIPDSIGEIIAEIIREVLEEEKK